jgi:hypothetical protein
MAQAEGIETGWPTVDQWSDDLATAINDNHDECVANRFRSDNPAATGAADAPNETPGGDEGDSCPQLASGWTTLDDWAMDIATSVDGNYAECVGDSASGGSKCSVLVSGWKKLDKWAAKIAGIIDSNHNECIRLRPHQDETDLEPNNNKPQDDDVTCACPEELTGTYCVTGWGGDSLAMCYAGACYWCGKDSLGIPSEHNRFALSHSSDPGPDGTPCSWILSYQDGIVLGYKVWDEGNPEGDYYRSGGGTYLATVTACEATCIPCDAELPPTGACCYPDGSCDIGTEDECTTGGGIYQGDDVTCAEADCPLPPTGACCLPDGSCEDLTEGDCADSGGVYYGDGTSCAVDDPPCEPFAPREMSSSVAAPSPSLTSNSGELGDIVASVATPVARLLRLPCIDPETKKPRPESPCGKAINRLNRGDSIGSVIRKRLKGE